MNELTTSKNSTCTYDEKDLNHLKFKKRVMSNDEH